MRSRRPCLALALLALPFALAAQDRVYSWTDAKGVKHYSDAPPASGKYEESAITRSGASTTPPQPAAQTAANAAAPAENDNCKKAKANADLLQKNVSVVMDKDGDGKPDAPLNDTEKANQLELANAQVKAYCSDAAAKPQG